MLVRAFIGTMVAFQLALALAVSPTSCPQPTPIRMLAWWEYMPHDLVKQLADDGMALEITEYKTNEQAVRDLSQPGRFDVAIVSNLNLPHLFKQVPNQLKVFAEEASQRAYYDFMRPFPENCLPFMWLVSVFAWDSRYIAAKDVPHSFESLLSLKNKSYTVAISDDKFEVAARIIGDNRDFGHGVAHTDFSMLFRSPYERLLTANATKLTSSDIYTNTSRYWGRPKVALFSWHGVIAPFLHHHPWMKVSLPARNPVIGLDYACIVSNARHSVSRLRDVLRRLTDRPATTSICRYAQYFSPYVGDRSGLYPCTRDILDRLLEHRKRSALLIPDLPNATTHARVNRWWQPIRYGTHGQG